MSESYPTPEPDMAMSEWYPSTDPDMEYVLPFLRNHFNKLIQNEPNMEQMPPENGDNEVTENAVDRRAIQELEEIRNQLSNWPQKATKKELVNVNVNYKVTMTDVDQLAVSVEELNMKLAELEEKRKALDDQIYDIAQLIYTRVKQSLGDENAIPSPTAIPYEEIKRRIAKRLQNNSKNEQMDNKVSLNAVAPRASYIKEIKMKISKWLQNTFKIIKGNMDNKVTANAVFTLKISIEELSKNIGEVKEKYKAQTNQIDEFTQFLYILEKQLDRKK